MGLVSTIAAAEAVGYISLGIEKDSAYYSVAKKAIPALSRLIPRASGAPGGTLAAGQKT